MKNLYETFTEHNKTLLDSEVLLQHFQQYYIIIYVENGLTTATFDLYTTQNSV